MWLKKMRKTRMIADKVENQIWSDCQHNMSQSNHYKNIKHFLVPS